MATDANILLGEARCYECYGPMSIAQLLRLAILRRTALVLDPMAATDPQTLAAAGKCYTCNGVSNAEAMELAMLDLIYQNSSSGGGGEIESGVILMWSGSVASIPAGWVLCNGLNGTPDLQNNFVVGAGDVYAVGATGGSVNHTHTGITDPPNDSLDMTENPPEFSMATGVHTHEFTTAASNNLPPYFALAYIMKL